MATCPSCQAANLEGRRFCAACGAALTVTCAACGGVNEPEARFCGGCGKPLGVSGAAPPIPTEDVAGARRQVTIMYADLTGYTRLSELLDSEELHHITGAVLDAIDRAVEDHGGTVHRHIGDAVMALFGTPVAHHDDPFRAVACALAAHKAVAELGKTLGRDLAIHVGIANGLVVVAGQGGTQPGDAPAYAVTGIAANLAARLNAMAGPGETLVSDGVHRAVEGAVDCETLGEVSLRGLREAVRVWRAVSVRGPGARRARGPFAGRRGELAQFDGLLRSCMEGGAGQAILLRGEAGVGKSRLVEELEARARATGFVCHKGLVLDFGTGRGGDAIAALVGGLLGLPAGEDMAARQEAIARTSVDGLVEAEQMVFLNDLLGVPQPVALRAIYDAMGVATRTAGKRRLVGDLARRASRLAARLLVIEDIHWADGPTLEHLSHLAAVVQDCPALLVMTTRIEGDPLDAAWRAAAGGPLVTMDIGPLREPEAMEMAASLSAASDGFIRRCIERAAGNPLFLEQLLREAEESGREQIPSTIHSLVLARTDKLAERDRMALQAASVIGQRFSLETLRGLLESPGYTCDPLVRHFLVRPEGEDFLFSHALIREGVYASLLKARRSLLHRQAAAWYAGRDPALHAEHLDRAGDPAAAHAYLDAAEAQSRDYHYDRALQLVDRGIEVAGERSDLGRLRCLRGEILHDAGRIPESIAAYEKALEVTNRDDARCRARIGLAAGMRMADRHTDALSQLEAAEEAATALDLKLELAQIHHLRGNLYFSLSDIERCVREHQSAQELAHAAGSVLDEVRALGGLGDAAYARGRLRSAHDYFLRCSDLARREGLGRIEAANRPMAALTAYYSLDIDGGLAEAQAAADFGVRVGHQRAEIIARHSLYFGHFLRGDLAAARTAAMAAQAVTRHLGARRFEAENLMFLAEICLAEGDRKEAAKLAAAAEAISRDTGFGFMGPSILAVRAAATDDPGRRAAALEEGERILADGSISHNVIWFRFYAMEAMLRLGDWAAAERHADALADYTRDEPLAWTDFLIARGRILAAHGGGNGDGRVAAEAARLIETARRSGLRHGVADVEAVLAGRGDGLDSEPRPSATGPSSRS